MTTRQFTRIDYGRRIERVLAHIARHLDEPLDFERLAGIACFSPFHFHRIFRSMTGETVADTLRRYRLHRASSELVSGEGTIAAIARRAGYGGVEAFTRAFSVTYGMPPAAYRRQGRLVLPPESEHPKENHMYEVSIRDVPPRRVAAITHRGPYLDIGTAFQRLTTWAGARGLAGPDALGLAVYYDDPDTVPAADLRSDACMVLPETAALDGDVHWVDIAGGPHAVLIHRGPYGELHKAYRWLCGVWLPQSGREPGDGPCYETYPNDCRTLPPAEWITEIHMPLA